MRVDRPCACASLSLQHDLVPRFSSLSAQHVALAPMGELLGAVAIGMPEAAMTRLDVPGNLEPRCCA